MAVGEDLNRMFDELESHRSVTLSPVERLLLATDGTMTHMLEALVRGPVDVDILSRTVDSGTLTRRVVLQRGVDGSPLVWARSNVHLEHVDDEMEAELRTGSMGIGDLLRQEYTETRREIVSMRADWNGDGDCPSFISGSSPLYLARSYEIHSDGVKVMSITEWLPKGLY